MKSKFSNLQGAGSVIAAALALALAAGTPGHANAAPAPALSAPTGTVTIGVGHGQLVRLNGTMSDLFVADDKVADVQVRSPQALYVFGKAAGETTVYATDKAGNVVFSANVRVGGNYDKLDQMLKLAMPEAQVRVTPMNGMVLLTGTVATPQDVAEISQLVQSFVGKDTTVVSRVKTATPLQVMLKVKFVEVNRAFAKSVGFNFLTRDTTNGFQFFGSQGSAGSINNSGDGTGSASQVLGSTLSPGTGAVQDGLIKTLGAAASGSRFGFAGRLLGLDILSAIDLAEDDGLATTLAEPNLTALSGETASFLAGGEIPIPVPQFQGVTTIEYKQYGVSLAFTPIVLSDGRISMRVRPEVSQLTASTVSINGYRIPGLTARRAETTVELGSGQSFMIGGLLSNSTTNQINKAPFLGDLPILGALFKSTTFNRNETELVIVVTPYLVRPVDASKIATPLDGYRSPDDAQNFLLGQAFHGHSGERAPKPTASAPVTAAVGPGFSAQ